jgi:hypothetical protein
MPIIAPRWREDLALDAAAVVACAMPTPIDLRGLTLRPAPRRYVPT